MNELTLNTPIVAHNEKLHVLELREPTYDEIETIGFPFTVSTEGAIKPDSAVTLKYLPLLAGIPRSSAAELTLFDIFKASMLILGFFTRSTGKTSENDSTTLPGSGN